MTTHSLVRKSHRKSRGGCHTCRQRRVKCDQVRPACSSCVRRHTECSYAGRSSPTLRTPQDEQALVEVYDATRRDTAALNVIEHQDRTPASDSLHRRSVAPEASFDAFDLRLIAHFHAHVCPAFEAEQSPVDWISVTASPDLEQPHLHYAVLAFAAAHLAHHNSLMISRTSSTMVTHHARAVSSMIRGLEHLDSSNADSLFLAASLLCLYEFATGPQCGQFLVFTDTGQPAEWIWLLKGVRSIVTCCTPRLLQSWLTGSSDNSLSTDESNTDIHLVERMSELETHLLQLDSDPKTQQIYHASIASLKDCSRSARSELRDTSLRPQTVFAWMYGLSHEFLSLLQAKQPMALLIFAHFNILLHQLRHIWYLEKWSIHIMRGIDLNMPREHRPKLLSSSKAIGYKLSIEAVTLTSAG